MFGTSPKRPELSVPWKSQWKGICVHMVFDKRSQTACQVCGFLASQVLIMIWLRRLRRAPSWCYSPRVQHPMHVGFWGCSGMERPHSLGLCRSPVCSSSCFWSKSSWSGAGTAQSIVSMTRDAKRSCQKSRGWDCLSDESSFGELRRLPLISWHPRPAPLFS